MTSASLRVVEQQWELAIVTGLHLLAGGLPRGRRRQDLSLSLLAKRRASDNVGVKESPEHNCPCTRLVDFVFPQTHAGSCPAQSKADVVMSSVTSE